jgi:hypothetical protein
MLNYYELLKILSDSTNEEIELAFAAFKNELLKFSPGISVTEEELRLRKPAEWDAYVFLLDAEKRREYDETLKVYEAHQLSKEQKPGTESQNVNDNPNWKSIALVAVLIGVVLFFIFRKVSNDHITEEPKWRTHHITDEIQILLPAPIDTSINIIPPYLLNYITSWSCCQSDLKGGFSVTIARFVMDGNFKISEKDISYIVNTEMGSHMTIRKPDSTNFTMNIRGYRVFVRKGTYVMEGTLRAFENYSMLKGNTAIKIIVAHVPDDPKQIKYAEHVFNSLTCF